MDTPYSTCNDYSITQSSKWIHLTVHVMIGYSTCNDYSITQSSKWIHLTVHVMIAV